MFCSGEAGSTVGCAGDTKLGLSRVGSGFISVGVCVKLGTCRRVSIATGEGSRDGSIDCSMPSPEFLFGQFIYLMDGVAS